MTYFRLWWLLGLFAVAGCSSIEELKLQPVSVKTFLEDVEIMDVECTLTNGAGKWFVTSPSSVVIKKSAAQLVVKCSKDDVGIGRETVEAKPNGNLLGNVSGGGIMKSAADNVTGIGFDYPPIINVTLAKPKAKAKAK